MARKGFCMVSPEPLTFTLALIKPVEVAVNLNQTLLLGPLLQQGALV